MNFSALSKWDFAVALACLAAVALHFAGWHDAPLLAVIVIGGAPLLFQIAAKILKGDFGTDLLAAVSVVTAALLHEYLAGTLIVLMLSGGQALESFALRRASFALRALAARMPSKARRKTSGGTEDVALEAIRPGDLLEVHPHEICPVDGTVVEGHGGMDEAWLTGEPYRISKAPGAAVLSGAINGDSLLVVRADRVAQDSRYAKIMSVMAEAEQRRPRLRRLADQIGAVFTPLAIAVALAAWYSSGDPVRFLAVMVIATPCPLLIAIPVTIIGAVSMAARRGIVIRDPVVLERLPTCRTAIFDKTGTLTYGEPELTDILAAPGFGRDDALRLAAGLEKFSRHPLASAVLKAAATKHIAPPKADRVSEKPGQGLSGLAEGHDILVTGRGKLPPQETARLPAAGHGLECILVIDGRAAAALQFSDRPRSEGKSFIGHLAPVHGFEKIMLVSGDRSAEVDYLAGLLGIKDALAARSPEQKLEIVRAETKLAPTLFMGDGINDAPALAAATVGIAFGAGSGVTSEAAGAVIMESSLARVDELLHISLSLRRVALQSALGGMGLSLIGMGFAAAGHISPVAGALLQEGIDVLAILNALRMTVRRDAGADIVQAAENPS